MAARVAGCDREKVSTGLMIDESTPTVRVSDSAPIRVLVVDDHDLFRTGLATLLVAQGGIEVVAQASGGRMGVRLAHELRPDVILMDIRMRDLEGVAATREIVERDPAARVIALTVASDDADVQAMIRAGACGYLAKDTPVAGIVMAIRAALEGVAWLSPRAAEVVLAHVRRADVEPEFDSAPIEKLSPREVAVLRLIARGMGNSQIADELGISPRTAKNHISNILAKLGLPSRVHAAIYAIRRGLS